MIRLLLILFLSIVSTPIDSPNCKTQLSKNMSFFGGADPFDSSFQQLAHGGILDSLQTYVANENWQYKDTVSVSDVFGGEPSETQDADHQRFPLVDIEVDSPFNQAKEDLGIESTQYVGCGKNALFSVLEYFGQFCRFNMLEVGHDNTVTYKHLAKYIIQNTTTINLFGSLYVSPSEIKRSFDAALSYFGYNNLLTLDQRPATISSFVESIDKGYPVIWGCALDNNVSKSHYLVVYAYENWSYYDQNGNEVIYPMFKVRYNWGFYPSGPFEFYAEPCFFDWLGTALYPYQVRNHYLLNDTDITDDCYYPFSNVNYSISTEHGNVSGTYLRTGYVLDVNNDQFLTMSAKRQNAGVAQITINFPEDVSEIHYLASLWGSSEGFDFLADSFVLEGKTLNGSWTLIDNIPLYLLTSHRESPKYYYKLFDVGYRSIRFVLSTSASGDRNKGRVVLHNLTIFGDSTNLD